jgi:hypothetical protein
VVSFGSKDLEWVQSYIRNQRERHERGQAIDRLERITDMEDGEMAQAEPREAP